MVAGALPALFGLERPQAAGGARGGCAPASNRGSKLDAWSNQYGQPKPNHTHGHAEAVRRQQERHRQAVAKAGRRGGQLTEQDELSLSNEQVLADDAKRRLIDQTLVDLEQDGVDRDLLARARPLLEAADPYRQAEIVGTLRRTGAASNPGSWPNAAADQVARVTLGLGDEW